MDLDKTSSTLDLPAIARQTGNYIGGRWENEESECFVARNPATGDELASLPQRLRNHPPQPRWRGRCWLAF